MSVEKSQSVHWELFADCPYCEHENQITNVICKSSGEKQMCDSCDREFLVDQDDAD